MPVIPRSVPCDEESLRKDLMRACMLDVDDAHPGFLAPHGMTRLNRETIKSVGAQKQALCTAPQNACFTKIIRQ
jgi:hypothetical protein